MKRKLLLTLLVPFFLMTGRSLGQIKYDDFEGNKYQSFGLIKGMLDSAAANPGASSVNASLLCAKYDRSGGGKYGFIKMYPVRRLANVSSYATHTGTPQRLKLKVFTSAPAGTVVEIQLGKKGDDNYPSGVHSQYQAVTTVRNQWEELTFTFSQVPEGSLVASTDVDKITVLFAPNSSSTDIFYFDDLEGPALLEESISGIIQK